ncbi:MAG: calcium/proton exchanger [Thermomicrobiales bacterium]|nr:calcium/proton exchanger [Thermomicrobiales bacterium]
MKVLYALLIFLPVALYLEWTGSHNPTLIFVTSALAMIPLAGLLGSATENVAVYTGPRIGALLNATLGNAAELIISVVALRQGLIEVVKASIVGSIVGNILIVLGLALLLGGLRNGIQVFDARTAGTNATMLVLAVVALSVPAVFSFGASGSRPAPENLQILSDGMAVVLIALYACYLIFILRSPAPQAGESEEHHEAAMKLPLAIGLLVAATLGIVVMSEVLVGALEPTAEAWGLSDLFIGVMLVPLVGNVAEHLVAVQMALRNKMDLSLGIAVGSGLQVALFVAPVLVLVGIAIGRPMTLVFNAYELAALVGAGLIAALISVDGESNWLEGAQLVALYVMLGLAFFFVP